MADKRENTMTDAMLDRLLREASQPAIPLGALNRMTTRIAQAEIKTSQPVQRATWWLAGLPLAASLALGIFLGTQGYGENTIDAFSSAAIATAAQDELATGTEEAELAAEEDLS
jgi:hypothetical protein